MPPTELKCVRATAGIDRVTANFASGVDAGCVDGCLAATWPVVSSGGLYKVDNTKSRKVTAIFNPREWEAMAVTYVSPIHQAIQRAHN